MDEKRRNTPSHCPHLLNISLFFQFVFLLILSHRPMSASDPPNDFAVARCRNIQQACAAQLINFPPLPSVQETAPDMPLEPGLDEQQEGSGEGQAEGVVGGWPFVPMAGPMSFPLAEPLGIKAVNLCTCPESDQCNFDNNRTVKFSPHVRVAFCKPVDEVFKLRCEGSRTLARVIGTVDRQKNDLLSEVNDTLIFCRCESERWSRVRVEPWIKHFSFSFKCLDNQ
uniref:Uncharacterized protein n=1 Tax=Globodera rostochiensis TaxID=31243 RepID=A0A914HYJ8_GLORO